MICIDNSEWMRNSDFSPSRSEAQEDACNLICGTKTRQNLENVVGLITTAGKAVEVQVSLTQDLAKFLTALHKVKIGGKADVMSAIQVAQLALRHRQNKLQGQRIVLFVGSPIEEPKEELVKLAQQLKKNKIAVDIVSFGEVNAELNQEKLEAFHKAINNNDNSALVTIPPGARMLSELLAKTPIVRGVGAPESTPGTGAGEAGGFDFVDENIDPELAMTLKLSLETEEAERKARAGAAGEATPAAQPTPMDEEEDPELAEALRQSLLDNVSTETPMVTEQDGEDDDDELQRAMLLSQSTATEDREADEKTALLGDQEKPKEENPEESGVGEEDILLSLPDIDPNDPDVQALLAQMRKDKK